MLFCDGANEISNECSIFRKKVGPLKRNGASCLNKTDLKNNENIISTSIICYNGTLATIKVLKNMAKGTACGALRKNAQQQIYSTH